jgi:hypothetical protein
MSFEACLFGVPVAECFSWQSPAFSWSLHVPSENPQIQDANPMLTVVRIEFAEAERVFASLAIPTQDQHMTTPGDLTDRFPPSANALVL